MNRHTHASVVNADGYRAYVSTLPLKIKVLFICCDVKPAFNAASLVSALIQVSITHTSCACYTHLKQSVDLSFLKVCEGAAKVKEKIE